MDLTEACLASIKTWNPKINAWITVMREKALAQAKALADEQAAGRFRSPLHGIPIGLKDSIDTAGVRTTAASAVYEYRFPSEDAEVVRRLKAAGAVLIGKSNMHEFDAGASSAVSYWGPVRNPWNLERISGGASGGSAAAVAMANCFAALGTDSGGGIRIPASDCGITGLKPTYGRVSLRGIVPFAWSLDHCGPMARTVEDAALVLQQIAGYDHLDIDSVDKPVPDYAAGLTMPVAQFRIGIAAQFFDHLDDEVARAVEDALAVLNKLTKGSHEVGMPSLLHAGVSAEIAAYHENLRGVNGGGYEPSTARVFPAAQDASRAVDYVRGWRELTMVRRTVDEDVFTKQNVEVLVAPVVRHLPALIEEELNPAAAAEVAAAGAALRRLAARPVGGGGGRGAAGGGGIAGLARCRGEYAPVQRLRLARDLHSLRLLERRDCPSACRSRARCSLRRTSWRWRTLTSARPTGTSGGPACNSDAKVPVLSKSAARADRRLIKGNRCRIQAIPLPGRLRQASENIRAPERSRPWNSRRPAWNGSRPSIRRSMPGSP